MQYGLLFELALCVLGRIQKLVQPRARLIGYHLSAKVVDWRQCILNFLRSTAILLLVLIMLFDQLLGQFGVVAAANRLVLALGVDS